MVTTLKLAKDLNIISLEELVISLRSHEIKLEDDEPQKQDKPLALKSNKYETKFLQEKTEAENYRESSSEEDELFFLSRRINQLRKHR